MQKNFSISLQNASVHEGILGSKDPAKINHCSNCFNRVENRCHNAVYRGAAVSSFSDLHFEEKNQRSLQRLQIFKLT